MKIQIRFNNFLVKRTERFFINRLLTSGPFDGNYISMVGFWFTGRQTFCGLTDPYEESNMSPRLCSATRTFRQQGCLLLLCDNNNNNGNGNDSSDSGFFIQFKQGELQKRDMFYTTPKIDRSELLDATNINNTDVWVQQIDENGKLLES